MHSPKMLSEAVSDYMDLQKARRGSEAADTLKAHLNVLNMFVRISGDRQIRNVTADHVEKFFYGPGGIRDEHVVLSGGVPHKVRAVSNRTHNHYRSRLATFFEWCRQKGYLNKDVMLHTSPLKVRKETRNRPAPVALLEMLNTTTCPRDRAFLATTANTALRSSEICAIRIGDVDLDGNTIAVTIRKTGDADNQPMSLDLENELRTWLTRYAETIGRPLDGSDYLFPARTGGLISHYETLSDGTRRAVRHPHGWDPQRTVSKPYVIVQKALEVLGEDTHKEGVHTIRRAVAAAYFEHVSQDQGDVAALRETAALLHHQSVATTEIYLGMSPEKKRRDDRIKGRAFLSAMVPQQNVLPLHAVGSNTITEGGA